VNNNDPASVVDVIVAMLGVFLAPEFARLLGPYAAIVLLASAGAVWALTGLNAPMGNRQKAAYVLVRVFVAISLTVSIVELLHWAYEPMKPKITFCWVAFLIGRVPDFETFFIDAFKKLPFQRKAP
jgi:hypothetical protein